MKKFEYGTPGYEAYQKQRKELKKKYTHGFNNFLGSLFIIGETNEDGRFDWECILQYVEEYDDWTLARTIADGLEVLAMKDFPGYWVFDTTNLYPMNYPIPEGDISEAELNEQCREWMKELIKMLERESVKSGKLTEDDIQRLHAGTLEARMIQGQWELIRK